MDGAAVVREAAGGAASVEQLQQRNGDPPGGAERATSLAERERLGQAGQHVRRVVNAPGQDHHAVGDAQQRTGAFRGG
jgi:hypothetical protein